MLHVHEMGWIQATYGIDDGIRRSDTELGNHAHKIAATEAHALLSDFIGHPRGHLPPNFEPPGRVGHPAVGFQEGASCRLHGLARVVSIPQAASRPHVLAKSHAPCIAGSATMNRRNASCCMLIVGGDFGRACKGSHSQQALELKEG